MGVSPLSNAQDLTGIVDGPSDAAALLAQEHDPCQSQHHDQNAHDHPAFVCHAVPLDNLTDMRRLVGLSQDRSTQLYTIRGIHSTVFNR